MPENDIRYPAAIIDNVGNNVGDCAIRVVDLYESSSANIIAAMIFRAISSEVTFFYVG
ncbi:MAG: sodium/proton-translocating pyrophosphatase [Candidatus Thorarchaeota archaeon]